MLARQIAVGFGIAIVFPLLIYYGVSTISHPPKRPDYHDPFASSASANATPEQRAAVLATQKAEDAAYGAAERVFSLWLLCVAAPLGYAAILLGSSRVSSGLGSGLMFGGIFAVSIGYGWHWVYVDDWLRFVSLLVAMAVLVFVSYRRWPLGAQGGRKASGP